MYRCLCARVCVCIYRCVFVLKQSLVFSNCLLLEHVFRITPYSTALVCSSILYLTNNILHWTQLITLSVHPLSSSPSVSLFLSGVRTVSVLCVCIGLFLCLSLGLSIAVSLIAILVSVSVSRCAGGKMMLHLFILPMRPVPAVDTPAHTMETTAASTVTHTPTDTHTSVCKKRTVCQVKQSFSRFVISSIHLHFSTTTGVSYRTRTHTHANAHAQTYTLAHGPKDSQITAAALCAVACWTGNGAWWL